MRWLIPCLIPCLLVACVESEADETDEADEAVVLDELVSAVPGCSATDQPTGVRTETIQIDGVDRGYLLSVPVDYNPARSYPLVFGWHGLGSSAELSRLYFGIEQAAGGNLIMVYPQGLGNPAGWNLDPDGSDFRLFDALLARLESRYCIDAGRVYGTGHSFGAYMTNAVGCHRPGVLSAIAPVAGGGPFATCPQPTPALIVHGTGDAIVPFFLGQWSRDDWKRSNGCTPASWTLPFPAPCVTTFCASAPVTWCEHSEPGLFGHGWPTFAAPVIWTFFQFS